MEGRPLEDEELVERAKNGDIDAYGQLVRRYQDIAFRTAYVIAGGTGDAEDAAQEAFVKAYHALGRFREGASFKPWLLTIVANEARNRLRSASRRAGLAARVTEDRASGDAAPSPEVAALKAEERATLLSALDSLGEQDRLVLTYRYFFELSESEMAQALGCRPGTVKSRLSRAMKRLRATIVADAEDVAK